LNTVRRIYLLSLLIPAYNEEQTIEETVKYASRLNYPNYEVIVINDGSKDRTFTILKSLLDQYPKLRVVNGLRNRVQISSYPPSKVNC
jgi:poly-beta-1,6-N-acetyl-D-glucosamine synthase